MVISFITVSINTAWNYMYERNTSLL